MGFLLRGRGLRVTGVVATLVSFAAGSPAARADGAAPGPVLSPLVQGVTSTSITVGWQLPADASGITGYRVDYSGDQGATWQTGSTVVDASATSSTVSDLESGVAYDVRIEAYG